MIVSTRGRYALRVMIDLAQHTEDGYVPLKEVAERQGISEKYLEAILKQLVDSGLVSGVRGKNGGYKLVRKPCEYTAWDVISVTENDFHAVACLSPGAPLCERAGSCATLPMWKDFNEELKAFFTNYTIEGLADGVKRPPDAEKTSR